MLQGLSDGLLNGDFQDKSPSLVVIITRLQKMLETFGHLHSLVQTLLQPTLQTIFKSLIKEQIVYFSDLVSLKAKYIAVIRDFVVAGYDRKSGTVYNQRVKWSGINDSSTWTPSQATQSGFQDIVGSHGNFQAIVGGESAGELYFLKRLFIECLM